jgi:hypothetical protein
MMPCILSHLSPHSSLLHLVLESAIRNKSYQLHAAFDFNEQVAVVCRQAGV